MKKITTLLSCLFFIALLFFPIQTDAKRGYIVTRDAKIITGEVVAIFYSDYKSTLTFVNDLGNIYEFGAMLIWGFGFINEDGKEEFYESKFQNNRWLFLKNIYRGTGLSLYKSTARKSRQGTVFEGYSEVKYKANEFWLQIGKEQPFRLYRSNYKRLLRRHFPGLKTITKKLGKRGFRFLDLPKIIRELDEGFGKRI